MTIHNPSHQVLIAFDFGMKRIGVAVGQTLTKSARPLDTLPAKEGAPNIESLKKIMQKWRPNACVVGIPLNMDGSDQPITHHARQFANWLKEQFHLPVYEVDERLTTKDARERLFKEGGFKALQDGQVDSVAAQLILQNWLDEN
jgi:putative holliday junction resolvase